MAGSVRHQPWPLQQVNNLKIAEQTIDAADGLAKLDGQALASYSTGVEVEFLPIRLV
jgi:uncharacterized protein YqjF (DUF2071 family)